MHAFLIALSLASTLCSQDPDPSPESPGYPELELRDDLVVTQSAKIKAGEYLIADQGEPGVLIIRGEGVRVNMEGVVLRGAPEGSPPDQLQGIGIRLDQTKGGQLIGGAVHGFRIGVEAFQCEGGLIEKVDASDNFAQKLKSTPEKMDDGDWLDIHDPERWRTYGASFWLQDCTQMQILSNRSRRSQNGIVAIRSHSLQIRENDCSFHSGWGLAFHQSTGNVVTRNRFDYCVREESWGRYSRGGDSAGILLVHGSSKNRIIGNSATHGGDGFFLTSGPPPAHREFTSDQNVVQFNDFSHSPHNAIEATFSRGNQFIGNHCSDSGYGFWLGYAQDCQVLSNDIHNSLHDAIAIEWGENNKIRQNRISRTRGTGIRLWKRGEQPMVEAVHRGNVVRQNQMDYNNVAIRVHDMEGGVIRGNRLLGNAWDADVQNAPEAIPNNTSAHRNLLEKPARSQEWVQAGTEKILPLKKKPLHRLAFQFHWDPIHDGEQDLLVLEMTRVENPGPDDWQRLRLVHGRDWPLVSIQFRQARKFQALRWRLLKDLKGFQVPRRHLAGSPLNPPLPVPTEVQIPPVPPPGQSPRPAGRRYIRIGEFFPLPPQEED
ncbi:MAG: right-handed parallel beta-helix repeat-containing protein [Planctomycetota bacterium]|nr:MAG: right-handed parallel beta-helix repeat-containing protein [Planctomycetota bacterium]